VKPLPIAALAAAGGVIALVLLFPRFDPSAKTPLTLDRSHMIERTRGLATRFGVDTSGWDAEVTDQTDPKLKEYIAEYPQDPTSKLFGLLRVTVTLKQPNGRQTIQAVWFSDGRPAQWKWDHPPEDPHTGPAPDSVLADFLGSKPCYFVPNGTADNGVVLYDCVWSAKAPFELTPSLKMEQKAGSLLSVTLSPTYADHFENHYKHLDKSVLAQVAAWTVRVIWAAGLIFWLVQMIRGRMRWPIPAILFGGQVVWALISFFGGTYFQEFVARRQSIPDQFFFMMSENWTVFWSFLWLPVLAGAGLTIKSAGNREKWHSMAEIARGRLLDRTVAESIACGILSGIGLASIPYLVTALRWLPGSMLQFRSVDALVAPSSAIVALRLSAAVPPLAVFGFLYPSLRNLRKSWWFWGAFVPLGILVLMDWSPFHAPVPALATAVLLFASYLVLYLRCDVLTVLAAAISARAAVVPSLLLSQPLSSERGSAIELLAVAGAVLAVSVYWSFRGREPEARPETLIPGLTPDSDLPAKSDRERLQAEFEVARKAQQDALPAEPPQVPGFSLAGWCEPALQVGGDLYEFFPLPDGRLGIAVADVSGKGVPAALYMMVTKGLITAVSRESNQLAYILEQTNLHLYKACRKKVFVTMAAVVLDSANRRLEYGRAGHNPVVWRRKRKGQTTLLKPPGVGLGMTAGERFLRGLRIEEFELEPEDAIVLYSDGVTEAVDSKMEQFGEERLMRAVENTDGQSALDSRDAILRELRAFMGITPARDDITLVVIRA
jgi:hypothetical protein